MKEQIIKDEGQSISLDSQQMRNGKGTKKICFLVMPYGTGNEYNDGEEESEFILSDIIKPAVENALIEFQKRFPDSADFSLEVIRELEDTKPGSITENIIRHVSEAYLTIVDLTGHNPNVFFELGVRFALKRNGTILLTQDSRKLPFNIRNFRTVDYRPKFGGIDRARKELKKAILRTLEMLKNQPTKTTDSLVFQALPDLRVSTPHIMEEMPQKIEWEEYWIRIEYVTHKLKELNSQGIYRPDILMGISNGGLLIADTVLRIVYNNSLPLICLWAFRTAPNKMYFENNINDTLIKPEVISTLKERQTEDSASDVIRILLMDDIVGSKETFSQFVKYLKNRLGDLYEKVQLRFIFLYTPLQERIQALEPYLLSADKEIGKRYKMPKLPTVTKRSELPYRKGIHYGDVVSEKESQTDARKTPKGKK